MPRVLFSKSFLITLLKQRQFSLGRYCQFKKDIKHVYYIFIAILMLFLVIFEDDKSGNFLRGDKSFRTLKRTKSRQKQNK